MIEMTRKNFTQGLAALSATAVSGSLFGQSHEATGDADLDLRQSEIDAVTPRDFIDYYSPGLELGDLAVLEVNDVTGIGAFLNWGLEKDLLLPFSEQTRKVKKGERYLVSLYVDKSDRLCGTMKVYDMLRTDSPYKVDDQVRGIVFGINPEFGCFVAVDDLYMGMIPKKEMVRRMRIGEEVDCRVTGVREDGKLNLSIRKKAYLQIDEDSMKIMEKLEECGGSLPYHDKSSPEEIREEFSMSKNEFKRAIGRLYKMKKIVIGDEGISLVR